MDQWACIATKSSAFGPRWVNSLHYRTAAFLSASPQLAESIRAAKRFRVVPGPDASTCNKILPNVIGVGHVYPRRNSRCR